MVLGSFTVLTEEWKAKQRARWEEQVRVNPVVAEAFGCPSWMALEEWKGEKVEPFSAAFDRVKGRYFPKNVPVVPAKVVPMSPVSVEVSPSAANGKFCRVCGERYAEAGRSECAGCRKARQRKK